MQQHLKQPQEKTKMAFAIILHQPICGTLQGWGPSAGAEAKDDHVCVNETKEPYRMGRTRGKPDSGWALGSVWILPGPAHSLP